MGTPIYINDLVDIGLIWHRSKVSLNHLSKNFFFLPYEKVPAVFKSVLGAEYFDTYILIEDDLVRLLSASCKQIYHESIKDKVEKEMYSVLFMRMIKHFLDNMKLFLPKEVFERILIVVMAEMIRYLQEEKDKGKYYG